MNAELLTQGNSYSLVVDGEVVATGRGNGTDLSSKAKGEIPVFDPCGGVDTGIKYQYNHVHISKPELSESEILQLVHFADEQRDTRSEEERYQERREKQLKDFFGS